MKKIHYLKNIKHKNYMKSSSWKRKRQQKLKIINSCEHCNSIDKLEIHHITYKNYGSEKMEDLMVLCHSCHKAEHVKIRRLR